MSISKEEKKQIIEKYAINSKDTGSPEVQVAVLTKRIHNLTEHMKINKKDVHSRRGLLAMVSRRKVNLAYLKKEDETRYEKLISELGIRRIK